MTCVWGPTRRRGHQAPLGFALLLPDRLHEGLDEAVHVVVFGLGVLCIVLVVVALDLDAFLFVVGGIPHVRRLVVGLHELILVVHHVLGLQLLFRLPAHFLNAGPLGRVLEVIVPVLLRTVGSHHVVDVVGFLS